MARLTSLCLWISLLMMMTEFVAAFRFITPLNVPSNTFPLPSVLWVECDYCQGELEISSTGADALIACVRFTMSKNVDIEVSVAEGSCYEENHHRNYTVVWPIPLSDSPFLYLRPEGNTIVLSLNQRPYDRLVLPISIPGQDLISTTAQALPMSTIEQPTSTSIHDSISTNTQDLISTTAQALPISTTEEHPISTSTHDPIPTNTQDLISTTAQAFLMSTTEQDPVSNGTHDPISTSTHDPTSTGTQDLISTSTQDPMPTTKQDPISSSTQNPISTTAQAFPISTTEQTPPPISTFTLPLLNLTTAYALSTPTTTQILPISTTLQFTPTVTTKQAPQINATTLEVTVVSLTGATEDTHIRFPELEIFEQCVGVTERLIWHRVQVNDVILIRPKQNVTELSVKVKPFSRNGCEFYDRYVGTYQVPNAEDWVRLELHLPKEKYSNITLTVNSQLVLSMARSSRNCTGQEWYSLRVSDAHTLLNCIPASAESSIRNQRETKSCNCKIIACNKCLFAILVVLLLWS